MPLYEIPAQQAVLQRKANEYSFWGTRDSLNRVEPIASPHFALDLDISRDDGIFTIGSCFARNIEGRLAEAGYRLPMRALLDDPDFAGLPAHALNSFSPPSIWNELAWACGAEPFDADQAIVEVGRDKWVDLHVIHNVRPAARPTVLRRRAAITRACRQFMDCKLIVITLGLVECWFDRVAGTYLNMIPPPALLRRFPDRFAFHVLDHGEVQDYCARIVSLLQAHGRADMTILVSVSPVALGITHMSGDVMTANCYGKSLLRVVAGELAALHANVHYVPSFESVMYSDRAIAWENDLTHVSDRLVAHNVERLVRCLGSDEVTDDLTAVRTAIAAGGATAAWLHAVEMRKADKATAARFFAEFAEWTQKSPTFATEHVEWLVDQRQPEQALEMAVAASQQGERLQMARARALLMLKRPAEALVVLDDPRLANARSNRYWSLRVEAEGLVGDVAALDVTLAGWCRAFPKRAAQARVHVARALLLRSAVDRAIELLELALATASDMALAHILLAEARLERGEFALASESFARARPGTASEARRYARLKDRILTAEAA